MATTTVRHVVEADVSIVWCLEKAAFGSNRGKPFDLRRWLDGPSGCGLVATRKTRFQDALAIGYALYSLSLADGTARLIQLGVEPGYRREGVATRILEVFLLTCRRANVSPGCRLGESNLPAQLLLKSCGWKASRVVRDAYGEGEDAYLFTCPEVECAGR